MKLPNVQLGKTETIQSSKSVLSQNSARVQFSAPLGSPMRNSFQDMVRIPSQTEADFEIYLSCIVTSQPEPDEITTVTISQTVVLRNTERVHRNDFVIKPSEMEQAELIMGGFKQHERYCLDGFTIQTIVAINLLDCANRCKMASNCAGFNFYLIGNTSINCELKQAISIHSFKKFAIAKAQCGFFFKKSVPQMA